MAAETDVAPSPAEGHERNALVLDVYQQVKRDIVAFRIPPGTKYSENVLATLLQVDRGALRLALHMLTLEGYITNVGGHAAWQVRPLDITYYEELYDFRTDIEAMAIRRVCARHVPAADFHALAEFWLVKKSARSLESAVVGEADEVFHRTIVELAGNSEMLRTYNSITDRIRIIRRMDFITPQRMEAAYDEHAAILRALQAGRTEDAETLMRSHIDASRVELRRLTFHQMALADAVAEVSNMEKPV